MSIAVVEVSLVEVSSASSIAVSPDDSVLVGGVDGVEAAGVTDFGGDFPFLRQSPPNFSASFMDSTQCLHTKNVTLAKEGKFLSSSE